MTISLRAVVFGAFALALLGAVFLVGILLANNEREPALLVERVQRQLTKITYGDTADIGRVLRTALISLRIDEVHSIEPTREGRGGALIPIADQLLLMTHAGDFFSLSDSGLASLEIEPPPDNLRALRALSSQAAHQRLRFVFKQYRYLDALHVDLPTGARLFISYTEFHPERLCYTTTIASLDLAGANRLTDVKATRADWSIVYRTNPCLPLKDEGQALEGHMAGGALAFDGADLLLASGDYKWDHETKPLAHVPDGLVEVATHPNYDYGKVLRINIASRQADKVAMGLRNTKGLTIDDQGDIWTIENGPRGGDELNRIRPGANFGWPKVTLGTAYSELPWSTDFGYGRHDAFDAPAFSWVPSIAPSELITVRGFDEAWDGDLLFGTLAAKSLFRVRVQDQQVVYVEPIAFGQRIRSLAITHDGRLALWTDQHKLYLLRPLANGRAGIYIDKVIADAGWSADEEDATRAAFGACIECHAIEPGRGGNAPNLAGVFNRRIAGTPYVGYSDGLKNAGGRWTRANLDAYLADPQQFASDTIMPDPELNDPEIRAHIISLLEALETLPPL